MVNEEYKEMSIKYMQIYNSGNSSLLNEYAHDKICVIYSHFDNEIYGIDEYKKVLDLTHKFFPDLAITVIDVICDDNKSSVIWEYFGTHEYGELFGVKANGKKIKVKGITILEFEDGKVIKESGVVDNFSLLEELGAL